MSGNTLYTCGSSKPNCTHSITFFFYCYYFSAVVLQISLVPDVKQMLMNAMCCPILAKMEQLVQTLSVAIPAAALMAGKELIVPQTQMTVSHKMAAPSAFMVESVSTMWESLIVTALQTIQVNYTPINRVAPRLTIVFKSHTNQNCLICFDKGLNLQLTMYMYLSGGFESRSPLQIYDTQFVLKFSCIVFQA